MYKEFLKATLGEVSRHLLHTSYEKRGLFVWKLNRAKKEETEQVIA